MVYHMEKLMQTALVRLQFEYGQVSGNHQDGANGVRQVDRNSDMAASQLCDGEFPAEG